MSRRVSRKTKKFGWLSRLLMLVLVLYVLPVTYKVAEYYFNWNQAREWKSDATGSVHPAPDPRLTDDAIIQVYAARALRWRGVLGVHTWIATKRSEDDFYQRLEVFGYALQWSNQTVQVRRGRPDRYWYGSEAVLLRELRGGDEVDALIDKIYEEAREYRFNKHYSVWPGPNSNTFISHLAQQIPEVSLDLPPTAIGKDYSVDGSVFQKPPSGKGVQITLNGLLGFILSPEEGIELNILGLTAGIDFSPLAIKLPGIGRIGNRDTKLKELASYSQ